MQERETIIPREVERLREYQAKVAAAPENMGNVGHPMGSEMFSTHDPAISHDTVGAVALDRVGNIAARRLRRAARIEQGSGRLGDSSLIGCGCYANNESAAVSTTGWGEPIMKLVLAKWTADRVLAGNLPWSGQRWRR